MQVGFFFDAHLDLWARDSDNPVTQEWLKMDGVPG